MQKVSGGKHAMHSFKGTGTQKPGVSSQEPQGGSRRGWASGGPANVKGLSNNEASNADYAGTQSAGTSGPTKTGGDKKWAEGGRHAMAGNTGSRTARGGRTTP